MTDAPVLYPTAALREQIDRTVTDATLSPAARAHELELVRDQLMVLVGECERRIGDANLLRDAESLQGRRDELKARENADVREELISRGLATADELDALGYLSHDALDHRHEDGRTLAEGFGAFGLALLKGTAFESHVRRNRWGKFVNLDHPDVGKAVRGGKVKRVLSAGRGDVVRAYETRPTTPAALADHLSGGVGDHPALGPAALRQLRRKMHGRKARDFATRAEITSRYGAADEPRMAGSYEAERGRAYGARARRLERRVGRASRRGTRTDEVGVNPAGRVGQQQLLDFARGAADSPSTVDLHGTRREDGSPVFDADRAALHRAIIELFLRQRDADGNLCAHCDPIPSQRDPEVLFSGGGYAAGKGTVLRQLTAEGKVPRDALVLDPDAIKAMLPEFTATREGDPEANLRVYEEAWAIAQQVQKVAQQRKLNVIVDGISDTSSDEILGRVESFVSAGYKSPRAVYVDIPTDEAVRRAMKRALTSDRPSDKRYIPEVILRAVHRDVAATVPELFTDPRVASFGLSVEAWDNSGAEPHMVASFDPRIGVTVHAQGGWDRFRAKAHEEIAGVRDPRTPPETQPSGLPAGALSPGASGDAPEWRRYFEGEPDAVVPLASLQPTKPPEVLRAAIDRAVTYMTAAAEETAPKRSPIDVVDRGDGSFRIVDGNATYGAAHRLGFRELPIRFVTDEGVPTGTQRPGEALTGAENPTLAGIESAVLGALRPGEQGPKPRSQVTDLERRLALADGEIQADVEAALDRGVGFAEEVGAMPSLPDEPESEVAAKVAANPDQTHVIIAAPKDPAAARRKVAQEYGGDATQITDLNRASVVVPDLTQVGSTVEGVREFFGQRGWRIVSSKNRLVNGGTDARYRDLQMILESPDGAPFELQVHVGDLWLAKATEGHKFYERLRTIDRAAKAANRPKTPDELREIEALRASSAALYDRAWGKVVDRTVRAAASATS